MLVLTRSRFGLRIVEVYFAPDGWSHEGRADVVLFHQTAACRGPATPFHTLHLDLAREEADLQKDLNRTNRNEIARAMNRDAVRCVIGAGTGDADLEEFRRFYDGFAAAAGLPRVDPARLRTLRGAGALRLGWAEVEEDGRLCAHAHLVAGDRARLLHSASHFRLAGDGARRSLIGRANRALHWAEILRFKADGLRTYDFGGLSLRDPSSPLGRIDTFKRSFGGRQVTEYNAVEGRGLRGRLAAPYFRRRL